MSADHGVQGRQIRTGRGKHHKQLELIRGFLQEREEGGRDLPFFASFEDEPDASEKYREILRSRPGF